MDQTQDNQNHTPRRGDEVEAWIKRYRSNFKPNTLAWLAIDDMLDDYRLHADLGAALHEQVEER